MDNKKTMVMNTATRLFAERGFENTSVSSICEAANVSKGLLYHHFKNKNELLREIFSATTDRMIGIGRSTDVEMKPRVALAFIIQQLFTQLETDRSFFQLNLNIMLQPGTRNLLNDLITERSSHILQSVQDIFKRLDPDNYEVPSYMFIAELDGIALDYLTVFETYPTEELKQLLINRYTLEQ